MNTPTPHTIAPPPPVLTRLGTGVIEAGWLAALALTPLVFDVFAHQVFEPVKAYLVRLIALVMVLAWALMAFEAWVYRRRFGHALPTFTTPPHPAGRAMVQVAVAGWLWYGISTWFSVHPATSLWGAPERMQGFFTAGAYGVLFLSVVGLLRTRAQWERLVTTALITSFVVALYALIQYFQGDPLTWDSPWEQAQQRVASTLGNPIFAGAYLILVIPLTLYRVLPLLRPTARRTKAVLGLLFVLLLAAWSLHPLAGSGLAVGAWCVALWQATHPARPTPYLVPLCTYLMLGSLQTVALVHAQGRGALLGLLAGLFLFGLLYAITHGLQRRARMWVLVGVIGLAGIGWMGTRAADGPQPALPGQDTPLITRLTQGMEARSVQSRLLIWGGAADLIRAHPERLWTGHGPETVALVYPPYDRPERGRYEGRSGVVDNLHNAPLHLLVTQGLPGSLLYLSGMALLFYLVLQGLGLVATRTHSIRYLSLVLLGTTALPLAALLLGSGWAWAVPLMGVGLAAGVLAYVMSQAVMARPPITPAPTPLAGITLAALLMAHLVEGLSGLQIVTSQVYFWVFAAVAVAPPAPPEAEPEPARALPVLAWVGGLVMIAIYHMFNPLSLSGAGRLMVLWVLFFTGLFVWILAYGHPRRPRTLPVPGAIVLAVAGYAGAQFLLQQVFRFDVVRTWPYALTVVGMMVLWGAPALRGYLDHPPEALRRGGFALALALVGLAGWGAWHVALQPAQADLLFAQAQRLEDRSRFDESLTAYRAAVAKAPLRDHYAGYLAGALGLQAFNTPDPAARDALFLLALATNQEASTRNPHNADHPINRARLYRNWARFTADSLARQTHFQEADRWYATAVTLRPAQVTLHLERGRTLSEAGAFQAAHTQLRHALDLDPRYEASHLALARLYGRQGAWEEAVAVYREALRYRVRSASLFHGLAQAYRKQGDAAQAIKAYQASLVYHPEDPVAHRALMLWNADRNACVEARQHARHVLRASAQDRALQDEVRQVMQQCTTLDQDPTP